MYSDDEYEMKQISVEVLYQKEEEQSIESLEEDWSSSMIISKDIDEKKTQYAKGLCRTISGDICTKYIPVSDSAVLNHPYYKYPAIEDPGIIEALLGPLPKQPALTYHGQDVYLNLCEEMSLCPIRSFHKALLTHKVDLRYYGIETNGFVPIFAALKANIFVEILDLTSNWMNKDACFHLGEMLAENRTLTELIIRGCHIESQGAKILFSLLSSNPSLIKLDLSKNQIEDEGAKYLSQALSEDVGITEINLSYNNLTSKAVSYLVKAFEIRNEINHIDLSWNTVLNSLAVVRLCQKLAENKTFKFLNLSWNGLIGPRIGEALHHLLRYAKSLEVLILNNNKLGDDVICDIAMGLIRAKKLDTLDLSNNPLSPHDALLLLERLRQRSVKLRCLLLDDVIVDEDFMKTREEVLALEFRKNAVITHGYVRPRMVYHSQDMRKVLLKRADAIFRSGKKKKKARVDFALLILELFRQDPAPRHIKEFSYFLKSLDLHLDKDLLEQMAVAFPGPRAKDGTRTLNLESVVEYIRRLWPNKRLPPPAPPVLPPSPPPIIVQEKKRKGKKK